MRLMQRHLKTVTVLAFAADRTPFGDPVAAPEVVRATLRGSVFPATAALRDEESGLVRSVAMGILFPGDADVRVGDGVRVEGERFRCIGVEHWPHHTAVRVERIGGAP